MLTPSEMGGADRAAIEAGTPGFALMTAAGAAVGRAAIQMMGGAYGRRVLVLCGKGNNGGDGLVAAAWLHRKGSKCTVVTLEDPASFKGDAARGLEELRGATPLRFDGQAVSQQLRRCDLVVDAMFGTGFKGALSGPAEQAASLMDGIDTPVLAIDIPSGVNGETGAVEGSAIKADVTVTLGALKPGLIMHPGARLAGEVRVADIGIGDEHMSGSLWVAEGEDAAGVLPPRPAWAHKRSVGKVLVVAGSTGMAGAAALAATGALRAGAGLVWAAVPASIAAQTNSAVREAIAVGLPETGSGTLEAGAVTRVLELAAQADAVALGPGLSRDPETVEFVRKLVPAVDRPLVIDADGLFAFASSPEALGARRYPTVLTPHSGELGRLVGFEPAEIDADRIAAARSAAERTAAVVLLKGRPTIVARPDGQCVAATTGGPVLATGGTGDVLTGVIAALAAGGASDFDAAWAGAWIHGAAADLLSAISDRGLLAGDLLDMIPSAIGMLETGDNAVSE